MYLISYVVMYFFYSDRVRHELSRTIVETIRGPTTVAKLVSDATVPSWKGVGWFFYGANGVPVQVPGQAKFVSANVLYGTDWFVYAFTFVPVLLFLCGGYWTYKSTDARVGQWKYAGVGMALGYTVFMIVGAVLISVPLRGLSAGPNLLYSIVMGMVIPSVAGATGARIAA